MSPLEHGVYIIEKRVPTEPATGSFLRMQGNKKTVCPDRKYFHQNKLFFIHANYIF